MSLLRVIGWAAAVLAVVVGLWLLGFALFIGDCASFGGQCPTKPGPLLRDEVFWLAVIGGALIVGPPLVLARRNWYVVIGLTTTAAFVLGAVARFTTNR